MIRKIIQFGLGLVGFTVVVAGPLFLVKRAQFKSMGNAMTAMVPPPTVVTAATASPEKWESRVNATGTLAAVQGVTIGAEVPGKIVRIAFDAGAVVKAGDVLVQLDTSTEEAQLRAFEAAAALARANLERARELRQTNANAPADLDAADAQAKQTQAQAENIRAVIAKKSIRAPFAGRLGLRLVNLGQILKEGEPVVTLQTWDPIFVNFPLPQQRLSQIATGQKVTLRSDAAPGREFEGTVNAISPEIDPVTRNVRVQATVGNRDEVLRAGMFVNVAVGVSTQSSVLAVPATAILYAPYGDSVFVIEEQKNDKTGRIEKIVRQQFVRIGEARGDFVAIIDGIKAGQSVVSSGVFKLRSGMPVTVDNTLAPKAELAPKPKNA